jgi:hypothetical protein
MDGLRLSSHPGRIDAMMRKHSSSVTHLFQLKEMEESFTVLAIAFGIILTATAIVIFRVRKRRLRRNVISVARPEIKPPSPPSEIDSSNPQTDSPVPVPLETPNSILIENEQEGNEETTEDSETETVEPVADEPPLTKDRRKLSPENRGGARRGKRTKEVQEGRTEKTQRLRKPEVVCWQRSRKWFLGIELPDEYGDTSQVKVTQGNDALTTEGNSRWPISTFFGSVSIQSTLASERFDVPIAEQDKPYLLFKLSGQNLRNGRRIRYATSGTYLVVVADNWIRNEQLSGGAQVPPERCHLDGLQAHFFHLDSADDGRIAFLTPENETIEIPNRISQFELVGLRIEDASDEMGPLFGLSPPSIRSTDAAGWNNVQTIVIGEEGERRSGWRTSFKPDVETGSIELTPYLSDKEGGWFFVRIYDAAEGPPIESPDFRFFKSLQAINVGQHNALPMETGHKPVAVSIEWNNHGQGELFPYREKSLPINVSGTTTRVEIPPTPDFDKTEWILVSPAKSRVRICLLVERVWWTVCTRNSSSETLKWYDKAIPLSRHHCTATSDYQLRIRFPKNRWAKEVRVGFQQDRARTYRVEVTQQIVDIPLNHFEGASQLEDFSKGHPLSLWLDDFPEQTVAILPIPSEASGQMNHRHDVSIRLNIKRIQKYLNRLDRAARDASLSELLGECKKNWSSPGIRARREAYLLQTACVIHVSWRAMKLMGKKPIGRRKGWIRSLVKLAEKNPSSLFATNRKYEKLIHGTIDV